MLLCLFNKFSRPPPPLSAPPSARHPSHSVPYVLVDSSGKLPDLSPAHFVDDHILASTRASLPHNSLLDVRHATALSLLAKVARRPAKHNKLSSSEFRLHVPADCRVLLWTSPHSLAAHSAMQDVGISLSWQRRIFETLLLTHVTETRESYGAGLLRFAQFCNREMIGESARMPADRFLLTAFVADAIGSCSGKSIRNWLSGLRLWHLFNDAPWHGDEGWLPALKKSADRSGIAFKRPPRGPITREHLRAFRTSLDLGSEFGAAAWSVALSAFWGCRHLGELLIRSASKFSTLHDMCRSTHISRSRVDADLCPVAAWDNHERVNHTPPPDTPLFAFRSSLGWKPLTKDIFLRVSSTVFKSGQLDLVFGHSYRIGGSLELLSAGVAPEVVMKIGGWSSLCFLIYWRRLEQILPLAITRAWDARIRDFATAHGHPVNINSVSFDC
ncbi:hypothetical protein B0H17DRAFT_940379 [Mycena rosella]|uniref:DNA breaking-rejoining enzyme n=1 Tax=Mycena rosella TaxID=1033263 RepID=A0AAD7DA66_MYCRO|nr:hypothetical protein B0H17DRAFT_940379 [Mycena rosella]